ncbi:MAG: hypothetical protein HETSPECPRED_009275 [Heterodermia speciosa]|uniref:Protein kinase domain-containing protein n=1 Tax=Heterodermia speciosa TaxID=116794 RepID=A0A8H3IVS8_9LECA|nr:MAG: hypothetical protein HETSPECPRED_009275 [Heterodermia speciosa]
MLIWAVYDYDSVKSFGDSRDGKRFPDHYLIDDAFWHMDNDRNIKRRPSVDMWLENLRGQLQHRNLSALLNVLGLVKRMLEINSQTRIMAHDLYDTLKRINLQTKIDLEAYEDDSLLDQRTLNESRRQTQSLSIEEPDRDVSHLASSRVMSKPESQSSQNPRNVILGGHLTASPQSAAAQLRRRDSPLRHNTAYSDTGLRDRSANDVSSTGAEASSYIHSPPGRTPDISNTKHD